MSLYEEELEVARSLARVAGHIIMYHYRTKGHAERHMKKWPGGNHQEPVTLADKDSDAFITKELSRIFPSDGIISEEGIETLEMLKQNMNRQRYWCVDPLDGTREFLKEEIFEFCVMMALVDGDRPVLGVVLNPGKEEEYYAVAGGGAYVARGDKVHRLKVSEVDHLAGARIMASRSHLPKDLLKITHAAGIADENIVRMGSVGVKVGILSEARADLYLHPRGRTKIWDVAAPDAILTESGGLMSDCLGRPISYRRDLKGMQDLFLRDGIVASNGLLHEKTLRLLQHMLQKGEISIQP